MIQVALLIAGSATLLISCKSPAEAHEENLERLVTLRADSTTRIVSENGKVKHKFEAALTENYGKARQPYTEFTQGVYVESYDSLGNIVSTVIADYAINYENLKLWEAKGNVVVDHVEGRRLETQQLFWNQMTHKIYSNVDSRFADTGRKTDILVVGFESDEDMKNWSARKVRGRSQGGDLESRQRREPGDSTSAVTPGTEIDAAVPTQNNAVREDSGELPSGEPTKIEGATAVDAAPAVEEAPEVILPIRPSNRPRAGATQ